MVDEKPITKSDFVAALKEIGVATKDDVQKIIGQEIESRGLATKDDVRVIVDQTIESRGLATKDDLLEQNHRIFEERTEFHHEVVQPQIDALNKRTDQIAKTLHELQDGVNRQFSHLRDDIKGLKADLSDTPSRGEFEDLRDKVDRHHPTH